jgi:hypothetical protein
MDYYDKKEENSVAGDFKMFILCKSFAILEKRGKLPLKSQPETLTP